MSTALAEPRQNPPTAAQEPKISAEVAVSSLMALGDQHIQSLVTSMKALARTSDAQAADWERIKAPLAAAAQANVEALNWFVLPDGSYWSVQKGKEHGNLKDRAYFPRVLRGETIVGDLVVSKSTNKSVAIVAVPIIREGKTVGALGASVFLDKLSARIEKEMGLDKTMIFYSFDSKPTVGLDWDPAVIFADPMKLGPEVSQAFRSMLKQEVGTVEYTFRGRKRVVTFKKSSVTGWWYAFGSVPEGREKAGSRAEDKSPPA